MSEPRTTEKTTYDVRVIGSLWQPGITAIDHITVTEPMEYVRFDDETDDGYEIRMVQAAADHMLGNFSGIDAWNISRIVTRETFQHWPTEQRGGLSVSYWEHADRYTYVTELVAFDGDAETAWNEVASPSDEYEDA